MNPPNTEDGRLRTANIDARIVESLGHIREEDLPGDVAEFQKRCIPTTSVDRILRAAKVGKSPRLYQQIARGELSSGPNDPDHVQLTEKEKKALCDEQDLVLPQAGMRIVFVTVSLAAFLQGHVQSSMNGAALYREQLDLSPRPGDGWPSVLNPAPPSASDWALGGMNAATFFAAALLGCSMALPISDKYGRKGAMAVAAVLIFISSLAMACIPYVPTDIWKWQLILGLRIVNGIGMGIKAVNTPILASECAIGYWRGTSVLNWQLWVAFGILCGFLLNYIFSLAQSEQFALALVLGAPIIPCIVLLITLLVCPESPRYYLRRGPKYSTEMAFEVMKSLRKNELIATRDIYVLHKSIQQEIQEQYETEIKQKYNGREILRIDEFEDFMRQAKHSSTLDFFAQYCELFRKPRLRNALTSTSIVALSQQLCGINILAFYSSDLFLALGQVKEAALKYSMIFGAVNFVCGACAIKTIDTMGRRKWLVITLIPMTLCMAVAALSFKAIDNGSLSITQGVILVAVFLYLHAALYSPALGPVTFILAAESFPLSHREAGCAFAVTVNLLFAGLLSIFFPSINSGLSAAGCLGLFSCFNLVAFALIFLFVEETCRISLEDLDFVFACSKRRFARYQAFEYLPWLLFQYFPWLIARAWDETYAFIVWGRFGIGGRFRRENRAIEIASVSEAGTVDSPLRRKRHQNQDRHQERQMRRKRRTKPTAPVFYQRVHREQSQQQQQAQRGVRGQDQEHGQERMTQVRSGGRVDSMMEHEMNSLDELPEDQA